MKNYLTNLFNSPVFRHVQRLAVACLFLSIAASTFAGWTATYQANVKLYPNASGKGKVYLESNDQKTVSNVEIPVKKTASKGSTNSSHTFDNVTITAVPEAGSKMAGWYFGDTGYDETNQVTNGEEKVYTIGTKTVSKNSNTETDYFYVNFIARSYCIYKPNVKVYYKDAEGNLTESAAGGQVNLVLNNTKENGDLFVKQGDGTNASATFDFQYNVTTNTGYHFVGWETSLADANDDTYLSTSISYVPAPNSTCEYNVETSVVEGTLADRITYYAIFESTQKYYYQTVHAELAGETNGAQLMLNIQDGINADATVSGAPTVTYSPNPPRGMQDKKDFNVIYQVNITDPDKVSFKGWSSQPGAGVNLSPDDNNNPTKYTATYTTFSTDITTPFNAPAVYAILESYWYTNPMIKITDSSNKLGEIAYSMYEKVEPSNWAFEVDGTNVKNQVAVTGDEFKYDVYYYARPLNGAKFVGWATANDPSMLIPGSDEIPYKKSYTITSKDKNNPYKSDVLYAIFQSNVDVMYQDDIICYVDEKGNPNVNDAKVVVDMGSVNELHAELLTNQALFDLTDQYGMVHDNVIDVVSNEGLARLFVTYTGNDPVGDAEAYKTADIKLTTADGGETTITVQMKPVPIITFLPTYGKGSYEINHTDGRGVRYTMEEDSKDNIFISILQESMSIIELNLDFDAPANTIFKGWQINTKSGSTIFSENKRATYRFTESATVKPIYTTTGAGVFTILNDEEHVQYSDLQKALNVAKSRSAEKNQDQVVVFSNGSNDEAILPQGNYVIPNRVTLLIPGVGPSDGFDPSAKEANFEEDAYVYRVKHQDYIPNTDNLTDVVLGIDDYSNMSGEPVCYRKLVVADNTTITVEPGGSINMYAYLTFNQSYNYEARPLRYGQIELGENSQIILQESGNTGRSAQLYAFGYITGANSSRVIANAGSEVFELLQYSEVRGGTAIADLFFNRETNKVFPINQFYVQNIEIPLQINYGAVENVITTASMFSSSEYVVMSGLIVPNQSQYESGFMRMASGMKIIKTYDPYLDRLNITISSENNSLASLGFIDVRMGNLVPTLEPMIEQVIQGYNLGGFLEGIAISAAKGVLESYVGDVRLKSSEYVMPIPSNMDIVLENVNLTIPYDVAWLSGSTLKIDEKSILTIANGTKVFVYDFDEAILPETNWTANAERYAPGTGYYASNSAALIPISYTPNNSQHLLDANGAKIKSSEKTHIRNANGTYLFKRQMKSLDAYDGELVTGDAQWLVDGKIEVNGELYTTNGNARIISNSRGQVVFANEPVSGTVTKQAKLVGNQSDFMSNLIHTATGGTVGSEAEVHKIINFPVNSARLRNADGSFVMTEKDTYTYSPIDGRWIGSQEEPLGEMEGEVVLVTLPEVNKNIDIQISGIDGLTSADGITAAISWNGDASVSVSNISYNNGTLVFPLQYVPTNKAGEYDGVLTVSGYGNDISIRVVVTEDYTPKFDVTNPVQISQAVGYSIRTTAANFVLSPEVENVANTIRTAEDKYKATWTYTITGDDADEFTFHWGNGNNLFTDAYIEFSPNSAGEKNALLSFNVLYTDGNKQQHVTNVAIPLIGSAIALSPNPLAFAEGIDSIFVGASATELFAQVANGNTKPIVITPSISEYYTLNGANMSTTIKPNKVGAITITAEQDADLGNGIAATSISKTINITDNIVWNWENLYFGSENIYPISTLYDGWSLEVKDNHLNVIRDFTGADPGDYKVVLESWPDGEAAPVFTLTYNDGTGYKTRDFTSHVTRDPRQLSVYVNEKRVYDAVTLNVSRIDHIASNLGDDYYVQFKSTADEIAQWTFYFMGIPDKLSFNASGENNWQIEESANGTNWTTAYTWASISSSTEFELSLQPSTNYVRISYGTSSTPGVLSKIAVTELLSVKADVDKLYMPIIAPSSQKNVVFTYVSESDLALKTNNSVFTTNPANLTGSNQSPFYQIKRVAVNSTANSEIKDGMLSVTGSSAAVPIRTYTYPQELPIQLASDELERYYFVTSESYNTSWSNDEATRSIVMRNAVADASPYVVFHFADTPAPGVISFNYANISDGASWTVQESEDGTVWYDLEVDTDNEMAGQVMRKFLRPEKSRYVRVIYNSDYAGTVDITNMAILPTTSVVVNPAQLTVFSDQPEELSVIASNLQDVQFTFTPSSAFSINQVKDKDGNVANNGIQYFQGSGSHNGKAVISYNATAAVTYGTLTITTNYGANGTRLDNPEVLATVELTGINRNLPNGPTGIKTGTGLKITNFKNANEGDEGYLREVNSKYAFDTNGKPLFDYVIIYGETKTTDGSGTVTAPSSVTGSNAQTPCYIYKKSGDQYVIEDETYLVENANSSRKSWRGAISIADTDLQLGNADPTPENLRVYITGFCPYASTGYTQSDEGVWYFEGDAGDKIDIYLEDCYIYSRYKSKRGNSFTRESGESYSGMVARGSGAVLLFACKTQKDGLSTPLEVTIHTRESNLLKSHYGCLFSSFVGRAFQISSPVHIYMQSENHYKNSYTTLTFDDKWPTDANDDTKYNRTNGFLSLQKQVNNAPSIDMGNKNTVVNFRGGHVELQNACISSDNYESSLAISYRTGVYGPSKFRFVLSYGIGTDGVEGTVNFYDGTTTVLPMEVPERFRQYYLMDDNGTTTSCLRTPKNTYVYGGSHCMMRACEAPTSKGGAPTDGISALGKFEYTSDMGWNANTAETENHVDCRLVTPTSFPDDCLTEYYENKYTYGLKSVTPVDGKLNLWIPALDCPDSDFEVTPEVDQQISFWKASMTLIEANYGVYSGSVGGDNVEIAMQDGEQKEQVQNLLYCQIDDNISGVISAQGNDQYVAPVLNPAPDGGYISIAPTTVGTELQNYVRNTGSYVIEDKVYYVTTIPQADVWMNFTAPFNVANIYVVEAYDEDLLEQAGATRDEILVEQARHNANFAAFFGVAIALESKKTFNMIYNDYMGWVRHEYGSTAASKQGMKLLQHYYETYDAEGKYEGSNWRTADYYLYKNTANWMLNAEGNLTTQWGYVPMDVTLERTAPLLQQGETYSMLFPYCTGCWEGDDESGYYRDEWDYWSGKFIIFESTQGPHTIQGSDFVAANDLDEAIDGNWIFEDGASKGEAKLLGNSTFAQMVTRDDNVYTYSAEPMWEDYTSVNPSKNNTIEPTATFLYGDLSRDGIRPRITRNGEVIYDTNGDGTVTGGHIPTVGGGNDLFITATVAGINIAVAEPQQVRVMSATGAIIYSGMVQSAVDVALPATGVYVITGENEVHKILH